MEQTISSTSKSPFATEPIGRLIVKFAVPCVISLLVNSLYNIVDQIFIGWGVGYLGNGATLNSGTLGIDKCVDIIKDLY